MRTAYSKFLVTAIGVALIMLTFSTLSACTPGASPAQTPSPTATPSMPPAGAPGLSMTPMPGMAGPMVPPVEGLYRGQDILFIHTEASDPEVAELLTQMMNSPVIVVPSLALVAEEATGRVFVFTNGVHGNGPMGFQSDVFDSAPNDANYSPLRALNLVTWREGPTAQVLRSVEEVGRAERNGEITIEHTGTVINMPLLTWPGGRR